MDAINREFGRDTLRSAASGIDQRYTTQWNELPVVS
jgi:hypothetical protein